MKQLVEARWLCPGDVVLTSTEDRMRVEEWVLCGEKVRLRMKLIGSSCGHGRNLPFMVPPTTRFMRET